jgi:hypothetical protein
MAGCDRLAEEREGVGIVAGGVRCAFSGYDVQRSLIAHRAEDGLKQPMGGVPLGGGQLPSRGDYSESSCLARVATTDSRSSNTVRNLCQTSGAAPAASQRAHKK